jgi:hypothetical protein
MRLAELRQLVPLLPSGPAGLPAGLPGGTSGHGVVVMDVELGEAAPAAAAGAGASAGALGLASPSAKMPSRRRLPGQGPRATAAAAAPGPTAHVAGPGASPARPPAASPTRPSRPPAPRRTAAPRQPLSPASPGSTPRGGHASAPAPAPATAVAQGRLAFASPPTPAAPPHAAPGPAAPPHAHAWRAAATAARAHGGAAAPPARAAAFPARCEVEEDEEGGMLIDVAVGDRIADGALLPSPEALRGGPEGVSPRAGGAACGWDELRGLGMAPQASGLGVGRAAGVACQRSRTCSARVRLHSSELPIAFARPVLLWDCVQGWNDDFSAMALDLHPPALASSAAAAAVARPLLPAAAGLVAGARPGPARAGDGGGVAAALALLSPGSPMRRQVGSRVPLTLAAPA